MGLTADNPAVGCLLVSPAGRIVGRGATASGGRPHAERLALDEAGPLARGATAYVTLEPCAHQGRTPPCADALVDAGIRRVVIGARDPDPRVDGRGSAILRAAGIVVLELPGTGAERSFEGFLSRQTGRRPFVTLKLAVSADGFVGRHGEGQVAISGPVARRQVHLLRARSDAILVGSATAIADDPLLTCRLDGLEDRSPIRIVLDRRLRLPLSSALVRSAAAVPTWIATAAGMPSVEHEAAGCRILPLRSGTGGLAELAGTLVERGVSTLLVEGGPAVAQAFLDAGLVDRVVLLRSDHAIGEPGVPIPAALSHMSGFELARTDRFGADRWMEYERVSSPCSPES